MRRWIALAAAALAFQPAHGEWSASNSWTAPTQNEDGTPLTDLAGYRLYWGCEQSGQYTDVRPIDDPAALSTTTAGLPDTAEACYFVITALNTAGTESRYSGEAIKLRPDAPLAPPGADGVLVDFTWSEDDDGGGLVADAANSVLGSEVVDASGSASDSTSITVPSGTAAIVVFTGMWDGTAGGEDLDSLTIDGDSVDFDTSPLQNQATTQYGAHAGIGVLLNPTIGNVTLAWTWNASAPDEGGEIIPVYINSDVDTSSIAALVGDADADQNTSSNGLDAMQLVLTSSVGQLGLAYAQRFSGTTISITPDDNTLENNQLINSHRFDVVAFDPDAGTTTIDMATESYSTIAAIVLNPSSGISATLGQVTETDTAQAFTGAKQKAIGQASEADSAQTITPSGALSAELGQVLETDSAQGLTKAKQHQVNQASEADSAQALTGAKQKAIGQSSEADSARPFGKAKQKAIGQAVETDTARPITEAGAGVITETVNPASEADSALAFASSKLKQVGQSSEADSAQAMTGMRTLTVAQASEADTAQALAGSSKVRQLGQASEADIARPMTVVGGTPPAAAGSYPVIYRRRRR